MNDNEIIAVVSMQDDVDRYTTRKEIHDKGLLHRETDVLMINQFGILLQRRGGNDTEEATGQWCQFGGHVGRKETWHEAARREFCEETGIRLDAGELKELRAGPKSQSFAYHRCTQRGTKTNNRVARVFVTRKIVDPADVEFSGSCPIRPANTEASEIRYFKQVDFLRLLKSDEMMGGTKYIFSKIPTVKVLISDIPT